MRRAFDPCDLALRPHTELSLQVVLRCTGVDEAAGSALAEVFRLIGQRDFNDARNVTRRCLNTDRVRRYQLNRQTNKYTHYSVVL